MFNTIGNQTTSVRLIQWEIRQRQYV